MSGMPQLKQALVEIVAVAEKYDVGLGVTLSNEDCARYLLRLPSWSIVRAAPDGDTAATVRLREGTRVVTSFEIDEQLSALGDEERIKASLHALQSSADNMRRYAKTVDGITDAVLQKLHQQGFDVSFSSSADGQDAACVNTLAPERGKLN